jgi:hypothetical protein
MGLLETAKFHHRKMHPFSVYLSMGKASQAAVKKRACGIDTVRAWTELLWLKWKQTSQIQTPS